MNKKIAVFAHYDKDNIIDDYVIYYLKELKKVAEIVFVSDCNLPKIELKKIDKLVIKSIAKRHGEYDFGSYKLGYLFIEKKLKNYDELIFANDSCYGPFYPFKDLWKKMDKTKCDFWGIFKHWDFVLDKWHIQSYFLVFKKQVFTSKAFAPFIKKIKRLKTKRDIVVNYEIGISSLLYKEGFKDASLSLKSKENETHLNKTFSLILKDKNPLLKKTFLAKNPVYEAKLEKNLKNFFKEVKEQYPIYLIEDNLERTASKGYKDNWFFYRKDYRKAITVFHKKIIRYKYKNQGYFYFFTLKILGISIFKLPILFNSDLWKYKRRKK